MTITRASWARQNMPKTKTKKQQQLTKRQQTKNKKKQVFNFVLTSPTQDEKFLNVRM